MDDLALVSRWNEDHYIPQVRKIAVLGGIAFGLFSAVRSHRTRKQIFGALNDAANRFSANPSASKHMI